jgi:hypothetical protein
MRDMAALVRRRKNQQKQLANKKETLKRAKSK